MRRDLLESNSVLVGAWEHWTRRARRGEVFELPGLAATWSNVSWPILNAFFLSRPVEDRDDLEARIETALAEAAGRPWPWIFMPLMEWLPRDLEETARKGLEGRGFEPQPITGMVTDELLPPRRSLPELDYRQVGDTKTRRAMSELNCTAYDLPIEWGYEAMDVEGMWDDAFSYVGYLDGKAVTTATTVLLMNTLYMGWVATLPECQKGGYGEAVMRYSLARAGKASGWRRTLLHATDAGRPLYEAMGYRSVASFVAFLKS